MMHPPIYIYDSNMNRQGMIQDYNSFTWTRDWYGVDSWSLTANIWQEDELRPWVDIIDLKGFISFVSFSGKQLVGIIQTIKKPLDETGKASENWTIGGGSAKAALGWRDTMEYFNNVGAGGKDAQTTPTTNEAAMRHYVDSDVISPTDTDRILTGISLATDGGRGGIAEETTRAENLLEVLSRLSKKSSLNCDLVWTGSGRNFVFTITQGTDRSATINLSSEFGSVLTYNHVEDWLKMRNLLYMAGTGSDATRTLQKVYTNLAFQWVADLGTETDIRAFANGDAGIIIAGTLGASGKIWRSANSGATWGLVQTLDGGDTYALCAAGLGGGVMLVGGYDGAGKLWRSIDNGLTWAVAKIYGGASSPECLCDCGAGVVVSGHLDQHAWRSVDYGANWTDIGDFGYIPYKIIKISTGQLLAACTSGRIFKSDDQGASWSYLSTTAGAKDNFAIMGLGGGIVLCGTLDGYVYRSTDNGSNWGAGVNKYNPNWVGAFLNLGSGIVLMAGYLADHVIYISYDYGVTWTDLGAPGASTYCPALISPAGGAGGTALVGTNNAPANASVWRVENCTIILPTGWDRIEDFVDASDCTTTDQLYSRGAAELTTRNVQDYLEFTYNPWTDLTIPPPGRCLFGTDFDLGDIIKVTKPNDITVTSRLITMTESYSRGQINVSMGIGTSIPDLMNVRNIRIKTSAAGRK